MDKIRTFISIDPCDLIRNRLIKLQEMLCVAHADIRWTKVENIHLTLAFLGNLLPDQILSLSGHLDTHLRQQSDFNLSFSGIGTFGHKSSPRIIWVGIDNSKALQAIHKQIVTAIHEAEIKYSPKPFSPHLTIGRVKSPKGITELFQLIEENKQARAGKTEVKSIDVIKSILTPTGAEYSVLHSVELQK